MRISRTLVQNASLAKMIGGPVKLSERGISRFVFVVAVFLLALASQVSRAEEQVVKSKRQIVAEWSSATDTQVKRKLADELRSSMKGVGDMLELLDMAHSAENKRERLLLIDLLKDLRIIEEEYKEEHKQFEPFFIRALDDPEIEIRIMAIYNLGVLRTKAAAPKLRKIVKDYGGLPSEAVNLIDKEKARQEWFEAGAAAVALGKMKDEESIPLLVERFYDLGDFGPSALSKMGKKALPHILELARKESDYKRQGAHTALACIDDKGAREDLIEVVKKEKDRDIKAQAMTSLVRYMYGDDILDLAKNTYEKEGLLFGEVMKRKEAIPILTHILLHARDHDDRDYAAILLEKIGDSSAVPVLEEALKDRVLNVRQSAAIALKKITGKSYDYVGKK